MGKRVSYAKCVRLEGSEGCRSAPQAQMQARCAVRVRSEETTFIKRRGVVIFGNGNDVFLRWTMTLFEIHFTKYDHGS